MYTSKIGMEFLLIPRGDFLMGSSISDPDRGPDEKPPHLERITRPFYLGATEVTRGQFRQFVDETGHQTEAEKGGPGGYGWNDRTQTFELDRKYTWRNPGFKQEIDHPVVLVSLSDAMEFARWLSEKDGKTYRLPSEMEWEYACRAGKTSRYGSGNDAESLAAVANIADGTFREKYPDWPGIAARDGQVFTAPVRTFRPNLFGLYDMHGNVWEWCSDECRANRRYWPPEGRPREATEALHRVLRGGSWSDRPAFARSSASVGYRPDYRHCNLGFRLAFDPPDR
jgi:formylglycine-generating enzyme required for sulfatase activity